MIYHHSQPHSFLFILFRERQLSESKVIQQALYLSIRQGEKNSLTDKDDKTYTINRKWSYSNKRQKIEIYKLHGGFLGVEGNHTKI